MFEDKTIMLPMLSKRKFNETQLEKLQMMASKIHMKRDVKPIKLIKENNFGGKISHHISIL